MSKLFSKVVIEDVKNAGCTDREVEILLDIYGRTVKRIATTLARKAYYELIRPNRNKLFTILVIDGAIYNSEFHFSIEDILANDWELVED